MAKSSVVYVCQSCGHQSPKWLGRCPACNRWETFAEERTRPSTSTASGRRSAWVATADVGPVPLSAVSMESVDRVATGIAELDRTLGGGVVPGSLTLLGGDPGVGKSTLALQMAGGLASRGAILYVSGEESPAQIKMRAERLGAISASVMILAETRVERIVEVIAGMKPSMVIIDSIQTIYTEEIPSAPGTVGQVREAAGVIMRVAKHTGVPVLLIGHVTKEGAIAGPRLLEHMVDTVLYFEGEKGSPFRILRAVKNRFGSANELGVFEMKSEGLLPVENPSEIFLSDKPGGVSGSVVTASMAGVRPLLVEIQALVAGSHYAAPKRTTVGVDANRLAILLAIIEKRCGFHLMGEDVFVNAAGGIRVDEPAIDLAVAAAIVSSFRDVPVDHSLVIVGEVGLGGEVRSAPQLEQRLNEAAKLGFKRAIAPTVRAKLSLPKGFVVDEVATMSDALDIILP
jgi:DNA repair protein RadA/Sms